MPRKKTLNEVKEMFFKKGLLLLECDYKDNKTPLGCVDEFGYKYHLSLCNINDKRTKSASKFSSNNPYTIENIHNYIKLNRIKCKLLSTTYRSSRNDRLEFICDCGQIYNLALNTFISAQQYQCSDCGHKKGGLKNSNSNIHIENIVLQYGYRIVKNTEIKSKSIHIEDKNGYRYVTSIYNLENRESKYVRFSSKNPYQLFNIKHHMLINDIGCEMLHFVAIDDIKTTKVEFRCSCCDKTFYSSLWGVFYEGRHRCVVCSKSQSNICLKVEKYLIDSNVKYIREYRFNDCRNINPLPFDFYLTEYNFCIEVQGSQHYIQNNWFMQNLEERKRVDELKRIYCEDNKIGYLAIPHWDIENKDKREKYKKMIDNILDQK